MAAKQSPQQKREYEQLRKAVPRNIPMKIMNSSNASESAGKPSFSAQVFAVFLPLRVSVAALRRLARV